jgi:hypothetical protein
MGLFLSGQSVHLSTSKGMIDMLAERVKTVFYQVFPGLQPQNRRITVSLRTRLCQRHQNGATTPGRAVLPQLAEIPLDVNKEMLVCSIHGQWQLPLNQEIRTGANSLHPRFLKQVIFLHYAT